MPVAIAAGHRQWRHRTPAGRLALWFGWLLLAALTIASWKVMTEDTIWEFLLSAPTQAADIASRMFPPRWSYMEKLWWPI